MVPGAVVGQSRWARIWAVVSKVPPGSVASYGQIAALAGLPRSARQVGYALHALSPGSEVPWHRVVNRLGELSLGRGDAEAGREQRRRLIQEGIGFDASGRVPMARYRWQPR